MSLNYESWPGLLGWRETFSRHKQNLKSRKIFGHLKVCAAPSIATSVRDLFQGATAIDRPRFIHAGRLNCVPGHGLNSAHSLRAGAWVDFTLGAESTWWEHCAWFHVFA